MPYHQKLVLIVKSQTNTCKTAHSKMRLLKMYAGELNVQVSQFSDLIGFPDCFSSPINSNLPLYQDLWPVDSDVGRDQVAKDIFIHLIDKVLKKLSILHSGH